MAIVLNNVDFDFSGSPDDVGMKTGATKHHQWSQHAYKKVVDGRASGNAQRMVGEVASKARLQCIRKTA